MLTTMDSDRRGADRIAIRRPCKVFEPRARKYVSGSTVNVARGGMLLRLDRPLALEPGDRLYVGVAQTRRHALVRSEELIEGTIVRSLVSAGEVYLAVRFETVRDEMYLPVLHAA